MISTASNNLTYYVLEAMKCECMCS